MLIQASCQIDASKEKCFNAFTDLNGLSKWVSAIQEIEILSEGDIGVGTRFRETRTMFGKESSEVMEITLFEPSHHLREEASSSGLHYISDWKFTEANGQTSVEVSFRIEAKSFQGKLMKLMFFFLKGSLKNAFHADMEDMKKAITSSSLDC